MPRVAKGMKAITIGMPPELYDRLTALASSLGRPVAVEIVCGLERHLESPPRLVEPALKPMDVEPRDLAGELLDAVPRLKTRRGPAPGTPAPPRKPQKAAERRTEARLELASLDEEGGITRVRE